MSSQLPTVKFSLSKVTLSGLSLADEVLLEVDELVLLLEMLEELELDDVDALELVLLFEPLLELEVDDVALLVTFDSETELLEFMLLLDSELLLVKLQAVILMASMMIVPKSNLLFLIRITSVHLF